MLTIYSGSSPCSAAVWIISRLRSRRKNVCSGSGALLFMSVAPDPELSLFHNAGSSSGFYSFSHINILIVFVCLKLNGKLMKSSTQNQNIPNILSNLIFFYKQRCHHQEISEKTNTNNLWNENRLFCLQCLRTFCFFLRQNQENVYLENYIRVRAFKHRPVPIDQVFCTRCMLCLLQY